jgi:hypothetical protein
MSLKEAGEKASSIRSMLLVLVTLFTITGGIAGGIGFLDTRYAHAEVVEQLEKRVTLAELKTSLRTAMEEYYFLKSQARKYADDEEIAERLTEAKDHVKELKELIKKKLENK